MAATKVFFGVRLTTKIDSRRDRSPQPEESGDTEAERVVGDVGVTPRGLLVVARDRSVVACLAVGLAVGLSVEFGTQRGVLVFEFGDVDVPVGVPTDGRGLDVGRVTVPWSGPAGLAGTDGSGWEVAEGHV